ncbi:transposase, partial [Thiolapillus sp.]
PQAEVTVDWFHIVQTFTRALDEVRKREGRVKPLPKHLRWSVLKRGDADHLTTNQLKALAELLDQGLDTATAWRIKERLDWIRLAKTPRAARWRITRFIGYARELIGDSDLLEPVRCRVPCDYIPKRSYPLFRTRQILNDWLTQNLEGNYSPLSA